MSLNRAQLGLLHSVPKGLGISEEHRRLIQVNHGGAESGRDMTLAGFNRVMSCYESQGWRDTSHDRGHWARQADDPVAPIRAKAIRLADLAGFLLPGVARVDYKRLDGFVARQTANRPTPRTRLGECDREDLRLVIEGLKAIILADPATAGRLVETPRRNRTQRRRGAEKTF